MADTLDTVLAVFAPALVLFQSAGILDHARTGGGDRRAALN